MALYPALVDRAKISKERTSSDRRENDNMRCLVLLPGAKKLAQKFENYPTRLYLFNPYFSILCVSLS